MRKAQARSHWRELCVCGGKKGLRQFVSGHRIKPQLSPLLCSSQEDMIIIGLTPKDVCLAVKKNPAVLLEQHILSNDFGSWFAHCLDKRKQKGGNIQLNILLSIAKAFYSFLCSLLGMTVMKPHRPDCFIECCICNILQKQQIQGCAVSDTITLSLHGCDDENIIRNARARKIKIDKDKDWCRRSLS